MALIKVMDVESVRFAAPDLKQMREFLLDFGLRDAQGDGDGDGDGRSGNDGNDNAGGIGDDGVLRMRGTGDAPFIHETVRGEPGFVAVTLRAASLQDLQTLAKADGVSIEPAPGPGGGQMVSLRDPDGYLIEVIADKARIQALPHGSRAPWNVVSRRERPGEAKRVAAGPASVVRLGHLVLGVSDMKTTWDWYQRRFGLLISDEVRAPNGDVAALFIRCDRGSEPVDHHTLNFASIPGVAPRFHHAAFEVADLDDLMAGSQFLESRGHRHDWGVGRHILGSQVFDYWRDPWGHRVEHWTDGDLFDASVASNVTDLQTMMGHQWGPAAPPDFAV